MGATATTTTAAVPPRAELVIAHRRGGDDGRREEEVVDAFPQEGVVIRTVQSTSRSAHSNDTPAWRMKRGGFACMTK